MVDLGSHKDCWNFLSNNLELIAVIGFPAYKFLNHHSDLFQSIELLIVEIALLDEGLNLPS